MNLRIFAAVTAVTALLTSTAIPAYAQQTVGPVAPDATAANSNSQSGSQASNTNANVVGPINASHGDTITGPSEATSTSTSGSLSNSGSVSQAGGGAGGAGGESHATSSATGGTSTSTTGASTSTSTANPNANNQGNAQNITFNNVTPSKQRLETNPTVYAPALSTTLTETCMGSTSGGVSVLGFGGTLGTTWNDDQCVRRLNAREMAGTLGDREAARALLCQDKDVARAYASVGQPCNTPYVARVALNAGGPTPYTLPAPPPAPEPATAPAQQAPEPSPASKPATTMAPIPNPTSKETDGERGTH